MVCAFSFPGPCSLAGHEVFHHPSVDVPAGVTPFALVDDRVALNTYSTGLWSIYVTMVPLSYQ